MVVEARLWRKRIGLIGMMVVASIAASAGPSVAQASRQQLLDAQQQAFDRMMAAPLDVAAAFGFAERSLAVDDFEGAILAYERLLLLAPDASRLRYDLAVLYSRLNAPQIAKSYLDEYLRGSDLKPEDRARAESLAASFARQASPNRLTGQVTLGLRSQSNANAGPSSPTIRSGGAQFPTTGDSRKQDDVNVFLAASIRHVMEFDDQSGDTLESEFSLYFTRQSRLRRLDLLSLDAKIGPRLGLFGAGSGFFVRPYVSAALVGLGNELYISGGGGGAQTEWRWAEGVSTTLDLEARQRTYHDAATRPDNSDQTGVTYGGTLRTSWTIDPDNILAGEFGLKRAAARRDWWDAVEASAGLTYTYIFDSPLGDDAPRWALSIGGQRVVTDYDSPDPNIDRTRTREDREWRANVTAFAPITGAWSVYVQGLYSDVESTIENYRFENYSAILGVTRNF